MIDLAEYQHRAVHSTDPHAEGLAPAIRRLAGDPTPDRLIVFDAPTGSGKTIMMAAALAEAATDLAVLWLTPSKGGLAEQTTAALQRYLDTSTLSVERLTMPWISANPIIAPGVVLVSHWDELTTKSAGDHTNRLTRGGETGSLFSVIRNTSAAGTPLVVVIDEAHWGSDAKGTSALLAEIEALAPFLLVEVSATPVRPTTAHGRRAGRHVDVPVDLDDVIASGLLRNQILVNPDLQAGLEILPVADRAGTAGETLVLDTAWLTAEELTARYAAAHVNARPLVLVQVPDSTAGEAKIAAVEQHFAQLGVTEANGRLAVWTSSRGKPAGISTISSPESPIDVLVFKQTVATGWDCPRAQILVAFREMKSEIFAIQTVGRILRTVERKHYGDAALDAAYIFANIDAPTGPTSGTQDRPPTSDVHLARRVGDLALPGSYASRAGTYDDIRAAAFRHCFRLAATATGLAERLPARAVALEDLASDRSVTLADVLDGDSSIDAGGAGGVRLSVAEHDLQARFDELLANQLGAYRARARSLPVMRQVLYDWTRQNMIAWWTGDDAELVLSLQRAAWADPAPLAAAGAAAVAEHKRADERSGERQLETFVWELPAALAVSSATHSTPPNPTGYAYEDSHGAPWRVNPSSPEAQVEALLATEAQAGHVLWWWKNGVGDRTSMSVAYKNSAGKWDTTYPDFVAELPPKTPDRRRIALLEAKAGADKDPDTALKAAALHRHANELRDGGFDVLEGIVVPLPGCLAINDGAHYTDPRTTSLTDYGSGWLPLVLA